MWIRTILSLLALAAPALAEPVVLQMEVEIERAEAPLRLMESVPSATLRRIRRGPERFIETGAQLIMGYGAGGAIGPAGLERYIALERAEVRAREMRRLLRADLDGDGAVTGAELSALIAAASARERGRLALMHDAADGDADGRVDLRELMAHANARALEEISQADADALRKFMLFDLDGDGRVALSELRRAVAALQHDA